jgi:putative transposase
MKEMRVLAERWPIHYNAIRPHSSLGYRSPAPETWQHQIKTAYGEVESKVRLPLPHTLDGGEKSTKLAAR